MPPTSSSPKRILVIDDNASIRTVVRACLEHLGGWEVLEAESGREGFGLAAAQQPDAIVLDVEMPGWDGPTTLSHLHEAPETTHIPVIFLTARGRTHELVPLRQNGLVAIFTKPFDGPVLVKRVALALQWEIAGELRSRP